MINLKHHYHILYTRMAHSRSVLVGGCEVNIRNINQYSYLPNMGNYVKNNTEPTIYIYIYVYIYKLPVSTRICIIFPKKLRNKKTTCEKLSHIEFKSTASDLDRLSELLQIAANLLKLRGRDSCNDLVVLLRDLHVFLGNAVFNQNCHTCICVDDRYLYVYIISTYLIICAKNMCILYTVCICIFTYIVSYIVYINS